MDVQVANAASAGKVVLGAGLALVVASFLPWVSAGGLINANLSGGGIAYMFLLGGALSGLGWLVLKRRTTKLLLVGCWILAVWIAINIVIIFAAFPGRDNSFIMVSPAIGVFVAAVAAIGGLVGTVMLQASKAHRRGQRSIVIPTTAPIVMSPDRKSWFDGANWHDARSEAPPGSARSADGFAWWDGAAWQSLRRPPEPPTA